MSLSSSIQLAFDSVQYCWDQHETVLRPASMAILQEINRSSKTHQSIVSRVLEAEHLLLEAGVGPTMQQATTNPNPALLSMVIRISLLSFSHEQQTLPQAIVTYISSEIFRETSLEASGPRQSYTSVLGVIAASDEDPPLQSETGAPIGAALGRTFLPRCPGHGAGRDCRSGVLPPVVPSALRAMVATASCLWVANTVLAVAYGEQQTLTSSVAMHADMAPGRPKVGSLHSI
ncbi:hypothetical protein FQN57_002992 [Myotisia sp. PD_48]|nr:hypothetical protein FQN57_002992 [Myotisia sp. PD_48]